MGGHLRELHLQCSQAPQPNEIPNLPLPFPTPSPCLSPSPTSTKAAVSAPALSFGTIQGENSPSRCLPPPPLSPLQRPCLPRPSAAARSEWRTRCPGACQSQSAAASASAPEPSVPPPRTPSGSLPALPAAAPGEGRRGGEGGQKGVRAQNKGDFHRASHISPLSFPPSALLPSLTSPPRSAAIPCRCPSQHRRRQNTR